ncbi:MAG TPA: SprT family zinc-dependent metalloprotease [Lysobacter sp.]|nr:SprT family zinc-dependent metalloprotease [Lysobacter sp.]
MSPTPPLRHFRARTPRAVERDAITVRLDDGRDVDVLRVRDPRARRIKLSVSERGVRLTLPPSVSLRAGERFIETHRDWLGEQILRHAIEDAPQLEAGVTAQLPLRGAWLPVRWVDGRYARVHAEADALLFQAPPSARASSLQRALRDFYEGEARADLGRWLPRYVPDLPRAPRRVQFKVLSSLWGSLSPDGAVSLDLALVLGRPSAFEYVLVHELCHLIHHNHSRRYWREVDARFPHWREERAYLHRDGRRLKAILRALLGKD